MICLRCLAQPPRTELVARPLRSVRSLRVQPTTNSRRLISRTTACSDAAQPFTTPAAASPTARNDAVEHKTDPSFSTKKKEVITLRSSVPAGTVLKGLNFHKDKSDPIAMEDSEYPDWLWTVLKDVRTAGGAKDAKKEVAKGKKGGKRSLSASAEVIPVHRQTIDLPTGDGTDEGIINALKAAGEITRAMRAERRAKIKENNFLRTMK